MKIHRRFSRLIASVLLGGITAFVGTAGYAAVVISNDPTQNMSCSGGLCTPTAADAILNVSDLFFMLQDSDVTLRSTEVAPDIEIAAIFGWNMDRHLTLDAYRSIAIRKKLTVAGLAGALTLLTNDGGVGGDLSFGSAGRIDFWNRSATLTINGVSYRLVDDIAQLATAVAKKPKGAYALANNYNARADGTYSHPPIAGEFGGVFEGLGHTLSNLSIYDTDTQSTLVGLFEYVKKNGIIRDLRLTDANVLSENTYFQIAGTIAGESNGTIFQCSATGEVRSDFWVDAGGLVGVNAGKIERSFADVVVSGVNDAEVGGLVGATTGRVENSYARGHVIAGDQAWVGGLAGYNYGHMREVYATGDVSGGQGAHVGGLIGDNNIAGAVSDAYWDTTTSGTTAATGTGDMTGITGLTTEEFLAGLPTGLRPTAWAEKKTVNSGYPYLRANPPPKK